MATVGKRRKTTRRRVSGTAAVGRTRRRVSGTAVGRRRTTHHHAPRRRVSGTAAVGRRRRRSVGSTSTSLIKQVVPLAVGMGIGAGAQHFLLRPLEHKIAAHFPMAAKFFALGEVLAGGYIALKAKNPIIRGAGLGIMAGGVHSGVKQLNLYRESPSVQGVGDYTTVRIPVNGQVRDMLSGIVRDQHGDTYTSLVAGSEHESWGDDRINRTNLLANIYGIGKEDDDFLEPKGW